ncbi:MAG TPA: TerB family tellurite resistance protein, partial [Flavobacteriales bacterium]
EEAGSMAFNKWIFGTIGFALSGTPIGAIVGFTIGALVDNLGGGASEPPHAEDRSGRARQGSPGDVALSLVVLTAAVMKADGLATRQELGHVREYFGRQFGPQHAAEMLRVLRDVLKREIPLRQVCDQMRGHLSHPERLQVMHFLLGLARVDGRMDPGEQQVLQRIGLFLGISEKDLDALGAMHNRPAPASAYTILEVDAGASDDEVKKAYRRAVMKHHPDKMAHLGEEFQRSAAEKFKKVKDAYERIQRERGMK